MSWLSESLWYLGDPDFNCHKKCVILQHFVFPVLLKHFLDRQFMINADKRNLGVLISSNRKRGKGCLYWKTENKVLAWKGQAVLVTL